ncbi:MAG: PEP-CTERM sorting domain-containing protein, partial [Bryobacteraceae bacterium]|nr:PEP-CTERM sorting domain-containing protein [Bryobacteraceae bacterium]
METGNVTAGNFVGIVRPTADIGGFKIIGLGATGFTIDDFTYGGASVSPVPEPASLMLAGAGLLVAA